MRILDDLIATLDEKAVVRDVRQGPFQTAVLTDASQGFTFRQLKGISLFTMLKSTYIGACNECEN